MDVEINSTYVNLGLLLFFFFCVTWAQFMAILYGFAARCLGNLLRGEREHLKYAHPIG